MLGPLTFIATIPNHLTCHVEAKFRGVELMVTSFKFSKKKLRKTGISRRSRAVKVKKCTKKYVMLLQNGCFRYKHFCRFFFLVAVVVMVAYTSHISHNPRNQDDNPHLGLSGREWRCLNRLTTPLFFGRSMHSLCTDVPPPSEKKLGGETSVHRLINALSP